MPEIKQKKISHKIIKYLVIFFVLILIVSGTLVYAYFYLGLGNGPQSAYDKTKDQEFTKSDIIYKGKTYSQLCNEYAKKVDAPLTFKCSVDKSSFNNTDILIISYVPQVQGKIKDVRLVEINLNTGRELYSVSN